MFQCPLEISPNILGSLIWCQPGGRNKIHTLSEVFNSLRIHPSTPVPSPHVFLYWPKMLVLLSRAAKFLKSRNHCLTEMQQLSGNSWRTHLGHNIRVQRKAATGGAERKELNIISFWVGLSARDLGKNKNLNLRRTLGAWQPYLPEYLCFFWKRKCNLKKSED